MFGLRTRAALEMRQRYRDLYSIYKSWTENEMTIEALLRDIAETNKKIAEYLERPAAPKDDGSDPFHNRRDLGPSAGYRDPAYQDVTIVVEDVKKLLAPYSLGGKDLIVARIAYAALASFYRPAEKPVVQSVAALQVAISEIMRGEHVVFADLAKPPRQITREQVSRCLTRAGLDPAPSSHGASVFNDIVDNLMELVNGSAR